MLICHSELVSESTLSSILKMLNQVQHEAFYITPPHPSPIKGGGVKKSPPLYPSPIKGGYKTYCHSEFISESFDGENLTGIYLLYNTLKL